VSSSTDRSRRSAADRQRRHRDRERSGLIVLPVVVDEADLAAALLNGGYIQVHEQDDRQKLTAALSRVIALLAVDVPPASSRVTADDRERC
jgi:hypothetical protein